jgi:hypothetical protein
MTSTTERLSEEALRNLARIVRGIHARAAAKRERERQQEAEARQDAGAGNGEA